MLKASEVLTRAYHEGKREATGGGVYRAKKKESCCGLGVLINPFLDEIHTLHLTWNDKKEVALFVSNKYDIPYKIILEIEQRWEGWEPFTKKETLLEIAQWLETLGY